MTYYITPYKKYVFGYKNNTLKGVEKRDIINLRMDIISALNT